MKKFYCPYCGEQTFSNYQKYIGKKYTVGSKAVNAMFFTCTNCHNEIERKSTTQGKKILNYVVPIYLILALVFFVLAITQKFALMLITVGVIFVLSLILTFISGSTCVLSRVDGNYRDILFPIEIDSKEIVVGGVYLLKPTSGELNKVSVQREYIAEITRGDSSQYFVRIIKPIDCAFEPLEFLVYDDEKCVGNGKLLV